MSQLYLCKTKSPSSPAHSTNEKYRVRNLKFATYLKFATCENTNKINELW